MATVIPADGSGPRYVMPANGVSFTLPELHAIVGGYIEALKSRWFVEQGVDRGELIMFLNEDGKRLGLPVNVFASALARAGGVLQPGDQIVGDVVLCTNREAGEDDRQPLDARAHVGDGDQAARELAALDVREDRCRVCNTWLGVGIVALHVGICERCRPG